MDENNRVLLIPEDSQNIRYSGIHAATAKISHQVIMQCYEMLLISKERNEK